MTQRFTTILLLCASAILTVAAAAATEARGISGAASRAELEILPHGVDALPYDKVFIERVAISYDETSQYRLAKPQLEERIAAGTAEAIHAALGDLAVVTEPGPGVLGVRAAITDVKAEKKPRRFWSYTPFGLVKQGLDAGRGRDFVLTAATVEVELYDGESGRQLAAVADFTGDNDGDVDGDLSFRTLVAKIGGWTRRLALDLATA